MPTPMASRDTEPMATGTYDADMDGQNRLHGDQNMQLDSADAEDEALGIKRAKRLKAMCICSAVTVVVSLLAIVVGVLAFRTSGSKFPYVMCGGAIAGGVSLLFTICPFCMFCEGRKTKTGNKMTTTFKCCIIGMLVWFSFGLCGIMAAWGMSGIWGMVECIQEKEKPGSRSLSACIDQTDERFAFSVLTLVLSSVLIILMVVISCIFCCNTTAFGYKTLRERQYDFYVRTIAREEIEREMDEQRRRARNGQQNTAGNRRYPEYDSYNHRNDTDARTSRDYAPNKDRRPHDNRDRERPREPSAPPVEEADRHRDRRPHHGRNHPRRPHDNDDRRNRPGEANRSRRRDQDRRDGRKGKEKNDAEAPPPAYDEVVNKYLKADDV